MAQTLVDDGSASAPGLAFTNDTNTGIYRADTDRIAFATAGAIAAQILADGAMQFSVGSVTNPGCSFLSDADTGMWSPAANTLAFSAAGAERLRIDTTTLHVGAQASGTPASTEIIKTTDGSGTNIAATALVFKGGRSTGNAAGGYLSFETTSAGASGSSLNTSTERWRITSAGHLIPGTTNSYDIGSNGSQVHDMYIANQLNVAGTMTQNDSTGESVFQGMIRAKRFRGSGGDVSTPDFSFNGDPDTGMYSISGNVIGFSCGNSEKVRIDGSGNVGIGTSDFGGGAKIIGIGNRTSAPGTPTGGGVLFVDSGALKYIGSSGTPTTIAPA